MRHQKKELKHLKKQKRRAAGKLSPVIPSVKKIEKLHKKDINQKLIDLKKKLLTSKPTEKRKVKLNIIAFKKALVDKRIRNLKRKIEKKKNSGQNVDKLKMELKQTVKKFIKLSRSSTRVEKKMIRINNKKIEDLKKKYDTATPREQRLIKRKMKKLMHRVKDLEYTIGKEKKETRKDCW
jgi:hypothetical protein